MSYEITDGTKVLTNTNSTLEDLNIATTSGVITAWDFFAEINSTSALVEIYTSAGAPPPASLAGEDASLENIGGVVIINNANFDQPGSWSTPLPAALPLFASGLGVMGLFGWRRKRKNAAVIAAA